jgi:hypothetical protein
MPTIIHNGMNDDANTLKKEESKNTPEESDIE